jgi:hypothetical protein
MSVFYLGEQLSNYVLVAETIEIAKGSNVVVNGNINTGSSTLTIIPEGAITRENMHGLIDKYIKNVTNTVTNKVTSLKPLDNNLNNYTLTPGYYTVSGLEINGSLTFDAGNTPNSVFYILIEGTLTISDNVAMALANGAQARNIYILYTGSHSSIHTNCLIFGNYISNYEIKIHKNTKIIGRILVGGITIDNDVTITTPSNQPIQISMTSPGSVTLGSTLTYDVEISTLKGIENHLFTYTFPSFITYLSSTAKNAMYQNNISTVSIPINISLNPNPLEVTTYSFTITAKVTGTGSKTNFATLINGGGVAEAISNPITTIASELPIPTVVLTGPSKTHRGCKLSFTATISGGKDPTGNIIFTLTGGLYFDKVLAGISNSIATAGFNTRGLFAGCYTVTATYEGDSDNNKATSNTLAVEIH